MMRFMKVKMGIVTHIIQVCFDLFDTKKVEFLSADDLGEIMRAMGFRPTEEVLRNNISIVMIIIIIITIIIQIIITITNIPIALGVEGPAA